MKRSEIQHITLRVLMNRCFYVRISVCKDIQLQMRVVIRKLIQTFTVHNKFTDRIDHIRIRIHVRIQIEDMFVCNYVLLINKETRPCSIV